MTYQLNQSEATQINDMLQNIAYRKLHTYRFYNSISMDDVVSEMWIATMELVNKLQRADLPLIAKSAYRTIVDIIRREHRRICLSLNTDEMESCMDSDNEEVVDSALASKLPSAMDVAIVNELRNLFPQGSAESIYLNYLIDFEALPNEELTEFPDEGAQRKTLKLEDFLAKKCGYSHNGSSGYQRMKHRVRAMLIEQGYFNEEN